MKRLFYLKLFNHLYDIVTDPYKENYVNNLLKEISNNIKNIDRSIKSKKLNKGIMFCANRNFTMNEKRKYGFMVLHTAVKQLLQTKHRHR